MKQPLLLSGFTIAPVLSVVLVAQPVQAEGIQATVVSVNDLEPASTSASDLLKWWMKYVLFVLVPLYKNSGRIVRMRVGTN